MTGGPAAIRIGQGLDVHRFSDEPDRPLILGGVVITGDGARGLDGHSDADAVAHAIADAVLGAAGLGDLGRHAPDTDPRWRRADSMAHPGPDASSWPAGPDGHRSTPTARWWPSDPGWHPSWAQMSERLSAVLGGPVNVKATTAEGLGALGRAEGIACSAVVLMTSTGVDGDGPV